MLVVNRWGKRHDRPLDVLACCKPSAADKAELKKLTTELDSAVSAQAEGREFRKGFEMKSVSLPPRSTSKVLGNLKTLTLEVPKSLQDVPSLPSCTSQHFNSSAFLSRLWKQFLLWTRSPRFKPWSFIIGANVAATSSRRSLPSSSLPCRSSSLCNRGHTASTFDHRGLPTSSPEDLFSAILIYEGRGGPQKARIALGFQD